MQSHWEMVIKPEATESSESNLTSLSNDSLDSDSYVDNERNTLRQPTSDSNAMLEGSCILGIVISRLVRHIGRNLRPRRPDSRNDIVSQNASPETRLTVLEVILQ